MAGRGAADPGAPLNVPPVLASNFQFGSERSYSRNDATPTWEAFEALLGRLEGGEAVAFASGVGAAAAVFDLLPVGAKVVLGNDCYQAVSGLAAAGAEQRRWRMERMGVEDTPRWIEHAADAAHYEAKHRGKIRSVPKPRPGSLFTPSATTESRADRRRARTAPG